MRTRAHNVRAVAVTAAVLSGLALLLAVVVTGPGQGVRAQGASADYFLKIDGIEGESTHDLHPGEIEVESWSWGETNSTRPLGTGPGVGKVSMNDFHFTMRVSKATPKLMLAGAQGRRIPSATLTVRRADGAPLVKWELKNVIVSSYQTRAEPSSGPPVDEVKLRFSQIVVTYTVRNADGTTSEIKAGWDLATNKKV